jgi:hypothetical protein
MIDIFTAIKEKDWKALESAIRRFTEQTEITKGDLLDLAHIFPSIVAAFPEQSTIKLKSGNIIWHRYEFLIWGIGESFRKVLKQHKNLRRDNELFKIIKQIASNPVYGKGRESFVMLLGQYGDRDSVGVLKQLLEDQEVQGHAIYALRLLGVPEVQENIRPFLQSRKTWVRNEAKKYFQKLEKRQA